MENIIQSEAKKVVQRALKQVADFNGDISNFTFAHFHQFHKKVFLRSLKLYINQLPCHDDLGNLLTTEYFDIDLTENLINNWSTISDCIAYVVSNHYRAYSNTKKLQLS